MPAQALQGMAAPSGYAAARPPYVRPYGQPYGTHAQPPPPQPAPRVLTEEERSLLPRKARCEPVGL